MRGMLIAVLGTVLASTLSSGQPPCEVEELARVGGEFRVVSGSGDIAVVSAGERLHVIDVSDPAQPRIIGTAEHVGEVWTHRLVGHHAFLVTGDQLRVFDLSDPTNPTQISAVTPRPGHAIHDRPAIDGHTAYLSYTGTTETTVVSVDISDPANPIVLDSIHTRASYWIPHISAAGGVVAVSVSRQSGGNDVWFIDASDPANLISSATVNTSPYAGDLATNGAFTYVFNWYHIDVYDSSNPYQPRTIGRISPWAWVSGELEIEGDRLFATIGNDPGGGSIVAYDIATPAQPVLLGSIGTRDMAWSITASRDRALVLFDSALQVVGGTPYGILGTLASEGSAGSVAVRDGRLYVASTSGLHVYDVRDPHNPVRTGQAIVSSTEGSGRVALNDHLVYLGGRTRLRVFDTSSGAPVLLAAPGLPCAGLRDADGPVVITSCQSDSLSIMFVELTDPMQPRTSPRLTFTRNVRAVAIDNGIALVSADALHVFDVSDPTSPTLITTLPERPGKLELKDGFAYACFGFGAVTVFDMRDPAQPIPVGNIGRHKGGHSAVVAQGTLLYSALYSPLGLAIHDIADPTSPLPFAYFDAPVQATDVAVDDDGLIAFARGSRGVSLLRTCDVCFPDCELSTGYGVLDVFDFLCFLNRFDAGYPYACDCDTTTGAGVCDVLDFICFGNAFVAGCP